ncbi:putative F-box associated domain, type 1 [Medicago truncatula]|uniref:Putative F-box associated domain, type 1 n=1 Tax=Medicago truncatula TaxID=3880 RepID=A0A396J2Y1_MEDTR|nr:putative F-box associated domain, type 1 [Medicago truncatula]
MIPVMPYVPHYFETNGVFVFTSVHWIMSRKLDESHPCLIVAFNLTLERFIEVPLPDELGGEKVNSDGNGIELSIAVLGGCLCMIVNYRTTKTDVWVMKQYGSRDSWCL